MSSDRVKAIATALGRSVEDVERDLPILYGMRRDLVAVVNQFFVQGGGWLHEPLEDWAAGFVERWASSMEYVAEVLPRYHMKTLLGGKIMPALFAIFGLVPYHVVMSHSEDNYKGNLAGVWTILTSPMFAALQWYSAYFNGLEPPTRSDNVIRFPGSGTVIEFRSLMSESRGANYAEAGGRPKMITLDDIIPTTAYTSETIRETITDRYLSMVLPMRTKGGQIRINGTVAHRDDLIGLILSGRLEGYSLTPPDHRKAYNERTGEVLFKGRWDLDTIMELKRSQYDSVGRSYMWRKEMLNDPTEADSHPFYSATLPTYKPAANRTQGGVLPYTLHRVVSIDHAQGSGMDYFVAIETGMDAAGNVFVLELKRSNEWDMNRRIAEVIAMLRRRPPHFLVVEDTTESRTFIEVLINVLAEEGIHVNLERPSASSRGNKNMHILGRLQPIIADGALIVPEGDDVIQKELHNFDLSSKRNVDDVIDALASGVRYHQKPDRRVGAGYVKTGDPLSDEILDTIFETKKPAYTGGRW